MIAAYLLLSFPNGADFLDEILGIFQSLMSIRAESWIPIIATLIKHTLSYHNLVEKYVDYILDFNYLLRSTNNFKEYLLHNLAVFRSCFGRQHEHTLAMRNWYISALSDEGKANETLEEWKRLGNICSKKFPPNHWINLDIKQRIVSAFHDLGMFQEAKVGFETLLKIEFEEDEITKNRIKGNYALTLQELNECDHALSFFNEVLAFWSNLQDEKETCTAKQNIAAIYYDQDRFSEAKEIFQELLEIRTKMFGEEDAVTLETKIWLAKTISQIYPHNHNLVQAVSNVYKHVHSVQVRSLGERHPTTLQSLKDLAVYLLENGNDDTNHTPEIRKMLEFVLIANMENFGDKHPTTLVTKFFLAQVSEVEENFVQALTSYEQVLHEFQIIYGDLHPSTISTKEAVGLVLYNMENFERAKIIMEEVFIARSTVFGRDCKKTLFAQYSFADCLTKCGEREKARKIFKEILDFDGQVEEDEDFKNLFQDTKEILEGKNIL